MLQTVTNLDLSVLDYIRENLTSAFGDVFFTLVTLFGEGGIFFIAVALALLCFKSTRKTGAMLGLALLFGLIIGNLTMKPLIGRVRPYEYGGRDIELIVSRKSDFSFPSGHTLAAFEAASVLMLRERRRFGYPALILGVLIAFSRLYLYVHYPTDVIAGAILGTAFGFAAVFTVNKVWDRAESKLLTWRSR